MISNTIETDFTTSITVAQSPKQVFDAVNNVRGWWSENIEGNTDRADGEFIYAYKDVHQCKMKITSFIPGRQVIWHVLKNKFSFTKDENEWVGNDIVFDIAPDGDNTALTFTQRGLQPQNECFEVCRDAWTSYIQGSLKSLIETGTGKPNTREHDLNGELVKKWGLPDK